jgi:soluble lytic murein transglycosylase-like protein
MKRTCAWLGLWALFANPAQAQVYTGVSDSGSVVLSSNQYEGAPVLLLEAERVAAVAAPLQATTAAFQATVPAGYLPFIQEASQAYKLPSELIHAVILVESNYNARAVSPKGAQGLMQLMPATAKRFGTQNSWDPRQNILAGAKYLRWLMDYFEQDMELSIAAYNAGEAAVMHAGRRVPKFTETEKYVPRVLSIYQRAKSLT